MKNLAAEFLLRPCPHRQRDLYVPDLHSLWSCSSGLLLTKKNRPMNSVLQQQLHGSYILHRYAHMHQWVLLIVPCKEEKSRTSAQSKAQSAEHKVNLNTVLQNFYNQLYLMPISFMLLYSKPIKHAICRISEIEQQKTAEVYTAWTLGQCQLSRTGSQP